MAVKPQNGKLIFAAVGMALALGWMTHTWMKYHPSSSRDTPRSTRVARQQSQPPQELTPEERRTRQHRNLYQRLEMTQEQRREARAIEQRLTDAGNYREQDFRRELRGLLTPEQVAALDAWRAERQAARQANQGA